ncbi:hypothetical protein NLX83_22005 [Allokutzneria sp. A3M-2-11 16]|uniref:hypothetical protein n=1 Tax=Allokutzneria sp. A3M-2-11 16 TaxID=2962043 RepID=UPI0020B809F7|nr:hypothetical protein [Allokutzneria sp. A3M-2-11 16]MCP3801946.1 hypothetical protein [Allokutzneria sp. A3M-2-11 16]
MDYNDAHEVSGELVVRFAKEVDPGQVEREARLLTIVAEQGCLAYFTPPGQPLSQLSRPQWTVHGVAIAPGGLLRQVQPHPGPGPRTGNRSGRLRRQVPHRPVMAVPTGMVNRASESVRPWCRQLRYREP